MDEETWDELCYAVDWYKPNADNDSGTHIYLGSMSGTVAWNACMGFRDDWWRGDEELAAAQAAMEAAQQQIAGAVKNAPWNGSYLYLDGGSRRGGTVSYDSASKTTIIKDWAFTGNSLQWNISNPSQLFNEVTLNSLPGDVSAVDVAVNGKVFTMKAGDTLDWSQLQVFFPWGDLPAPEMKSCSEDPYEDYPYPPVEWPLLENVVNELYPWNSIGGQMDLELKVVKVHYA